MTQLNPVTSLSQNGFDAPIGADDENIFLYNENGEYAGTLHDMFENWLDFKLKNDFVFFGDKIADPKDVGQIKV